MKKKLYKHKDETVIIWDTQYVKIGTETKVKVEYCFIKDGVLGERNTAFVDDKDYFEEFLWEGERAEVDTGK